MQSNIGMLEDEIEQPLALGQRLVALQAGALRGFTTLTSGRPKAYSLGILVDRDARRQGIGDSLWRQLLTTLPADAQQVSSECPAADADTHTFLLARGFQPWFSMELMHYSGRPYPDPQLTARSYEDADAADWTRLINEGFYPMREAADIQPYQIFADEADLDLATRQRLLNFGDDDHLLFYDGEQLVGMAELVDNEIATITVASHLRQLGYGLRIVAFCTNRLLARGINPVTLHVVNWSAAARRMYASMGWQCVSQHDTLRLKLG